MDARGRIRLVDRTKDLIKSGGEWISSVELENEIMSHPAVVEAAVIGVAHERWGEAPLACVVRAEGAEVTEEDAQALEDAFGELTSAFDAIADEGISIDNASAVIDSLTAMAAPAEANQLVSGSGLSHAPGRTGRGW